METIYWLVIFVVLVIIEIITLGLTTIWFAGGALVAAIMSVIGFGLPVQIGVFVVVSVALLILTRPIALKYFNSKRQKTNAESLIGQTAVVIEDVNTLCATGRVRINGMEWAAKTDEIEESILKDTVVSVEGIQGVKLIVKKMEAK